MSHTDPIADMLTRIRNAYMVNKPDVNIPHSKLKENIAKILKNEGYVGDYSVDKTFPGSIQIKLLYNNGESVISGIKKVSTPGRRVYSGATEIPRALDGNGVTIVSTSQGIITDKECRNNNTGGEVLLMVW